MRTTLTAFVLAVAVCGCGSGAPQRLAAGSPLPEFALESLGGATVTSRSLAGTPVVVNFWATWCQPCLVEIPELRQLAADGVRVVGIALDEEGAPAVEPFVERHAMDYAILLGDQEVFERLGGLTIPYTLLVDGAQKVVRVYRGPATRSAIAADLEGLGPK